MKKVLSTLFLLGLTCGLATAQNKFDRSPTAPLDNMARDCVECVPYREFAQTNYSQLTIENGQLMPPGLFIGENAKFRLEVDNMGMFPVAGTYMMAIGTERFSGPGLGWVDPASGWVSQQLLRWGSIPRDSFGNLNTHFYRVGTHEGRGDVAIWEMPIPNNPALVGQTWYAQAALHHYKIGGLDITPSDFNLLSSAVGGEIAKLY